MITSKLTTKAQTTLPRPVREALGIHPGDEIAYVIEAGRVILSKAVRPCASADDPFLAFTEWASAEDEEAYADL
jgi:antitoxin PrlF